MNKNIKKLINGAVLTLSGLIGNVMIFSTGFSTNRWYSYYNPILIIGGILIGAGLIIISVSCVDIFSQKDSE